MPPLADPRHETFARLRARGMRLSGAYEDAGFVRDRSHACRLAQREEVAARIEELRAAEAEPPPASARSWPLSCAS